MKPTVFGRQPRPKSEPDAVAANHLARHVAPRASRRCPLCCDRRRAIEEEAHLGSATHRVLLSAAEVDALAQFVRAVETAHQHPAWFVDRVALLTKFVRDLIGKDERPPTVGAGSKSGV